MNYHMMEARHVAGATVWLRFRDGASGEVDLTPALTVPVFQALRDPVVLRAFVLHPEFHTLV